MIAPTLNCARPSDAPLPPSGSQTQTPASTFTLMLGEAYPQDSAAVPDQASAGIEGDCALASCTAQEHPDQDAPKDSPWPPAGLASLWLPAAPEPLPVPPAAPASNPAPLLPAASPATNPATAATSTAVAADSLPDIAANAASNSPEPAQLPPWEHTWDEPAHAAEPSPSLPASTRPGAHIAHPSANAHPTGAGNADQENSELPARTDIPEFSLQEMDGTASDARATGRIIPGEAPPAPAIASIPTASAASVHTFQPQQPPASAATSPFPAPDLHADNFADTLSPHIQWLAGHKIDHAHLQLTPQEMGPIEVRLTLEGDQLHADFSSAEPEVRQALEHGLPRLRELLGEHGLNLAQGQVSQQSSQQHPPASAQTSADSAPGHADDEPVAASIPVPASTLQLLDAYA